LLRLADAVIGVPNSVIKGFVRWPLSPLQVLSKKQLRPGSITNYVTQGLAVFVQERPIISRARVKLESIAEFESQG
jgi:hypothetical protein